MLFSIRCPACQQAFSAFWWRTKRARGGKRQCPHCGTWMEMSNPMLVGGLCGLLYGAVIGGLISWEFASEWIRMALALILCWFVITPAMFRLAPRWQVLPDGAEPARPASKWSAQVRKWSRIRSVAIWVGGVVGLGLAVSNDMSVRHLQRFATAAEHAEPTRQLLDQMTQTVTHFWTAFKLRTLVALPIVAILGGIAIAAEAKRARARRAELEDVQCGAQGSPSEPEGHSPD